MNRNEITKLLPGIQPTDVARFISYLTRMDNEKKTDGTAKNPWMARISNEKFAELFLKIDNEGLVFDGVHITIGVNGVSFDYIAYKNKMLLAYPETIIDVQLVYKDDVFQFSKDSGKVTYKHVLKDPFSRNDADIIGGYCVIKNKRGEFLTTLSAAELEKHRKAAKTDYIWKAWFPEMCMKTLVKKGSKVHFDDIYENINEEDNQNYDPDQLNETPKNKESIDEIKVKVQAITTSEELKAYYETLEVKTQPITALFTARKEELSKVPA